MCEQVGAFLSEQTALYGDIVIRLAIGPDLVAGMQSPCFWITRAINNILYAGLDTGSRAHDTWFQGDIEPAARQAVIVGQGGGLAYNEHFRMGRRIVIPDATVASFGDKRVRAVYQDCANRHFTFACRFLRHPKGPLHYCLIKL